VFYLKKRKNIEKYGGRSSQDDEQIKLDKDKYIEEKI
jgi:hypothetical protein